MERYPLTSGTDGKPPGAHGLIVRGVHPLDRGYRDV
jgi:hypothetical protein